MKRVAGIDFGTTNSVVAIVSPDGSVVSKRFSLGATKFDVFLTVFCF
jgi:molecular chaperone DnaK (HSP70)